MLRKPILDLKTASHVEEFHCENFLSLFKSMGQGERLKSKVKTTDTTTKEKQWVVLPMGDSDVEDTNWQEAHCKGSVANNNLLATDPMRPPSGC